MISSKSKQIIKISKNIMLSFEGFLNKMNVVYNETKKKRKFHSMKSSKQSNNPWNALIFFWLEKSIIKIFYIDPLLKETYTNLK